MSAGERERRPDREVGWAEVRTYYRDQRGLYWRVFWGGLKKHIAVETLVTIGIGATSLLLHPNEPVQAGALGAAITIGVIFILIFVWTLISVPVSVSQDLLDKVNGTAAERDRARAELRSSEVLIEVASGYMVLRGLEEGVQQPDGTFIYRPRSYTVRLQAQATNPGDGATALDCTLILPAEMRAKDNPIVTRFTAHLPGGPREGHDLLRLAARWIGRAALEWRFAAPDAEVNVEELFKSNRVRVEVRDLLRPTVPPVVLKVPGETKLPGAGALPR